MIWVWCKNTAHCCLCFTCSMWCFQRSSAFLQVPPATGRIFHFLLAQQSRSADLIHTKRKQLYLTNTNITLWKQQNTYRFIHRTSPKGTLMSILLRVGHPCVHAKQPFTIWQGVNKKKTQLLMLICAICKKYSRVTKIFNIHTIQLIIYCISIKCCFPVGYNFCLPLCCCRSETFYPQIVLLVIYIYRYY